MTKYKVGQWCDLVYTNGDELLSPNCKITRAANIEGVDTYSVLYEEGGESNFWWYNENIKLKEKTMDNLQVGDTVTKTQWGDEYSFTVDGMVGSVYIGVNEEGEAVMFTASELTDSGYKLEADAKEMTVAEIEEKLGHPVKVVKEDE